MSFYSPYVLDASCHSTRALDPRRTAGGHHHNHLNDSAPTPATYPFAHAPVAASYPREHASNATYRLNASPHSLNTLYAAYGDTYTPTRNAAMAYGLNEAASKQDDYAPTYSRNPSSRNANLLSSSQRQPATYGNVHGHAAPALYGHPSVSSAPAAPDACVVPGFGVYRTWSMPSLAAVPPFPMHGGPPVHRLPHELLSQIFRHATTSQLFDATLSRRSIPLVISHVCGLWREVAIDLPGLWQWISLTGCPTRYEHHGRDLALLFMQRTKGLGMSVYYRDAEAASVEDDYWQVVALRKGIKAVADEHRCYCALDLIMARIAEIRVLELVIGHASSVRLSSLPASAAASLRTLFVKFIQRGGHEHLMSTLLCTSPQLRRLSWSSRLRVCSVTLPAHVSWTRLVQAHLDESPMSYGAFFDMLSAGQYLKDVWVRLARETRPPLPPSTRLSQFTLEKLQICGDEPLDEVFSALHLPALRLLWLKANSRNPTIGWPCNDPRALYQFIAMGTGALDDFHIMPGGTVDEVTLVAILALPQMATLTSLDAVLSTISDKLLIRLQPMHGGPSVLLPNLTKLTLGQCATSDGVFSRMLQLRYDHGYPLKNVRIEFKRTEEHRHPSDEAMFRWLADRGMYARASY